MDNEDAIFRDFRHGDLKYLDAIERLQAIGYEPKEAETVVSEWTDGLQSDRDLTTHSPRKGTI